MGKNKANVKAKKTDYIELSDYRRPSGFNYSFSEMVEILMEAKVQGILVYDEFNGNTYYSDTIEPDKAYLKQYGLTEYEYNKYSKNGDSTIVDIIGNTMDLGIQDYKQFIFKLLEMRGEPRELKKYDIAVKIAQNNLYKAKKENKKLLQSLTPTDRMSLMILMKRELNNVSFDDSVFEETENDLDYQNNDDSSMGSMQ